VRENPNHVSANTNLGQIYMQRGDMVKAFGFMKRADDLDPDYEQNLINLAVWYHVSGQNDQARKSLEHLLQKHPANEQAKAMLIDLAQH
jgi:Flp pilus assembly protein TadD